MDLLFQFLPSYLLILIRLTSFFLLAPYFSTYGVPAHFKIGLAAFLSILAVPVVGMQESFSFDGRYLFLVLKEIFVGLSLGFVSALFFYALQTAGGFIDLQMGFAFANIIDPQTGLSNPIMGNFKYILGILFLISTGGHHLLLQGILNSFFLVPLGEFIPIQNGRIVDEVLNLFIKTFIIAVQISAPLIVSLFLIDVALGFVSKTVPQFNLFVVGFPMKILAAFGIFLVILPGFFYALQLLFSDLFYSLGQFTRQMVR
ncbi:MAG: flagellar type III secretion system protein FliR [Thermicanus sp.]|nr:flagellar type III secretion system protein FliR [Thermicanus sp.]